MDTWIMHFIGVLTIDVLQFFKIAEYSDQLILSELETTSYT